MQAAVHSVDLEQSVETLRVENRTGAKGVHENKLSAAMAGERSLITARSANTQLTGHLDSAAINELSGMAPVLGSQNLYWAINDSGNRPELFATTEQGRLLNTFKLPVINRDWEDLASFQSGGENWVLIADTGDNLRRRKSSTLYFFKQPEVSAQKPPLKLHHRIDFVYEDGPQNVESMAVSTLEKKIFLIAKNHGNASIYALPLSLTQQSKQLVAKRVGGLAEMFTTGDAKWWERMFAKRMLLAPTALDISADDRMAVVANYRHAYLFRRDADESWQAAFARKPQVLSTHRMEQSESISFSPDSARVIISSEGVHAPVLVVRPGPASGSL